MNSDKKQAGLTVVLGGSLVMLVLQISGWCTRVTGAPRDQVDLVDGRRRRWRVETAEIKVRCIDGDSALASDLCFRVRY
jgi:hypothetical protein